MTDLVVTVPRDLWSEWIEEGDAVGEPETGTEWGFYLGHSRPPVEPGERCYIVAHDRVRGYAPVTRVAFFVSWCQRDTCMLRPCDQCKLSLAEFGHPTPPRLESGKFAPGRWAIGRKGAAVAVTIEEHVRGFQGWRKRWWDRGLERPFPGWIETDLWLSRKRAKAKREVAKASATATSSPTTQRELFE